MIISKNMTRKKIFCLLAVVLLMISVSMTACNDDSKTDVPQSSPLVSSPAVNDESTPGESTPIEEPDLDVFTEGLVFELNKDGTEYSVTDFTGDDFDVIIPQKYEGIPVTSIGAAAFKNCVFLETVRIPEGVTTIGNLAFNGCTSLEEINIPSSIDSVAGNAFNNCDMIEYNEYDNGLYLGNENNPYVILVKGKENTITSCNVNEATKIIAANAFKMFSNLAEVTLPNSIVKIDEAAFRGCNAIENIVIPNGVVTIGNDAFSFCEKLVGITVADSVTSIGERAFQGCIALSEINIPKNVKTIGQYAFEKCDSLENASIAGDDVEIGFGALDFCKALKNLKIYGKNLRFGSYPLLECKALENIYVYDLQSWFESPIIPFSSATIRFIDSNGEEIKNIVVPDHITEIRRAVFRNCSATSITLHNGVTAIDEGAFAGCNHLTSITIPASVKSIGENAFSDCSYLVEIINLSDLNITAGSRDHGEIAYRAFEVHNGESRVIHKDGYAFYPFEGTNYLIGYFGDETELILPDDVNGEKYVINKVAFYKNDRITSVYVSNGVTEIGIMAFASCGSLVSVEIAGSDQTIGREAFSKCPKLTSVTISSGVKTIDSGAFKSCNALKSITIPGSVSSIGSDAFSNCSRLSNVDICDGVAEIGESAFYKCVSLTRVSLPQSVIIIHESAFEGCERITSISIPGVKEIGDKAFMNCTFVSSVVLPGDLVSIGNAAFSMQYGKFYYLGTEEDWANITLGENWCISRKLKCYYYSDNEPNESDKYWRYVDAVPTVWGEK